MKYFAYGSNMSEKRLKARLKKIKKIGIGILYEHKLLFHKTGKDKSGKCDAFYTGNKDDFIYGVLYEIDDSDKKVLDDIEGLGSGYNDKKVLIKMLKGEVAEAFTYYAISIQKGLKPFKWYKNHVLVGALENNLPKQYIEFIKNVESIPDLNKHREYIETSIYD